MKVLLKMYYAHHYQSANHLVILPALKNILHNDYV